MMYDDDRPTLLEIGGPAIRRTCPRCLTQIKPRATVEHELRRDARPA
jgi:hypothetical protein